MKNTGLPFYSAIVFLICFVIAGCEKENSSPTSPETKTHKIAGKVIDKNGAGIPGLYIRAFSTNYAGEDSTDEQGAFLFKGLAPGTYTVSVDEPNLAFKPSVTDVTVSESDIDSLIFTKVNNLIHGRVIDIITNNGMADIPIYIQQENSNNALSITKTDSKGRYEFYDIPADEYRIALDDPSGQTYGSPISTFSYLSLESFNDNEISGPEFYMSSEKLQITLANYSEDTNTVHLEWTKSKSNFCKSYLLAGYGKLSLTTGQLGYGKGYFYETNSAFIEINPKYLSEIGNAKIIYYVVSARYSINELLGRISSPLSEYVSIQVAE